VVVIVFQTTFRFEMHQNDNFFFKLFLKSAHQNNPKHKKNNFLQKKLIFLRIQFAPYSQTLLDPHVHYTHLTLVHFSFLHFTSRKATTYIFIAIIRWWSLSRIFYVSGTQQDNIFKGEF
jgi:hypothetical protein